MPQVATLPPVSNGYPARTLRPVNVARYLVLLALVASGCASVQATSTPGATPTPSAISTPSATSTGSSGIIRVTGTMTAQGSAAELVTVTDGVRTRMLYPAGEDGAESELINVSDGTTQVTCDSTGCRRDAASEPSGPGTPAFETRCPRAKQTGTTQVAGRAAVVWSCAGGESGASELIFDAEFPFVQMKGTSAGYVSWEVTLVETNVTVPPDFFALEPPGRTFVPARPTQVKPPKPGERGAVLQKVGGGQLRMTDYTKGPAVVVIGEETQLRQAFARMQRVADGDLPTVVGVLRPSSDPTHPEPTKPFGVLVAQMDDLDSVWETLTEGQNWPVALFCTAKAATCTSIAVWDLSDAKLAAELAKVG